MGLNYHGNRIPDQGTDNVVAVRHYDHWQYDNHYELQVTFKANGQVEIEDGEGGEWIETFFMMRRWFDQYYPEIVDDLKANPIKDFPMEWPLDMLDTPVAIE